MGLGDGRRPDGRGAGGSGAPPRAMGLGATFGVLSEVAEDGAESLGKELVADGGS
jgi:hypothetical protein